MESLRRKEWWSAIESENASIEANETYERCVLPKGAKAIGTRWVFKTKRDENGNISRYKARLVARVSVSSTGETTSIPMHQ
jgi:hypothetical protein